MEFVKQYHSDYGLNSCLRIVGLAKSSWYYHRNKACQGSPSRQDQQIKDQIIEIIGEFGGYGWRKITAELRARTGQAINHKRVRRLLNDYDLQLRRSVKKPSKSGVDHLFQAHSGPLNRLGGRTFTRFELLSGDFTQLIYRRGRRRCWLAGFYDPVSCLPCGWAVGRSANTSLALKAWKQVRATFQRWKMPLAQATVHTDKDSVFKSYRWLDQVLCEDSVEVSFSERGAKDNPWIESLWSRLKDEHIQLIYESYEISDVEEVINRYFHKYTTRRRHQSLNYQIPIEHLNHQITTGEHNPELDQLVL